MRKSLFVLCFLFILVLGAVACSSEDENNSGNTQSSTHEDNGSSNDESSVEQSGELDVYSALSEEETVEYMSAFEEETGIDVNFVRLSAGEILARVEAEQENPQASIWYGGSTDNFIAAANEELLAKYEAEAIDEIDE